MNINKRTRGVMAPRSQVSSSLPTGTVLGFEKVEFFALRYVDEKGKEVDEIVQRFAGEWYRAPNGIEYAGQLMRINKDSKFAKSLGEQYNVKVAPRKAPTQDAADVMVGP